MSLVVPFEEIFAEKKGLLSNHHTWERIELKNIASVLNGYAFKSTLFSKEVGFPLIRIRDISKNVTETYYTGNYLKEYIVHKDDLLIGMDGNFVCYKWNGPDGLLNQRVCKIIPDERFLNKKFLFYGINGYLNAIQKATSSVTVGHLSSLDILRIPFPLPPINEQQRIADKLDEIMIKVQACQERLNKIPAILKRFRQAVLAVACSGRLTEKWREKNLVASNENIQIINNEENPVGWKVVCIGDVIESLKYGTARKCSYENKGIPILRIPNIVNGFIDQTDLKYAELSTKEFNQLRLIPGDILIIRSNGSVSLVGKSAIIREQESDFAYAGYLIRIRPNKTKIEPEFLNLSLGSNNIRLQIGLKARSTSGVNNINGDEVRALRLNLPPLKEQQEIIRQVRKYLTLADKIEARYERIQTYINKLSQSILAKAFRGELVPQDPNDEPASVLLERIRKEMQNK